MAQPTPMTPTLTSAMPEPMPTPIPCQSPDGPVGQWVDRLSQLNGGA
jgi:hypothetical protein